MSGLALRTRKGGVALSAVLGLIPVMLILLAALNAGQATHERRVLQDTSDAIAMSHQVWAARSLNVLSMNQVAATQITSVAIGAEALDEALTILRGYAIGANAHIAWHAFRNCPKFKVFTGAAVAACFAQHYYEAREAIRALRYSYATKRKYQLRSLLRLSYDSLRALDAMNQEIIARFPRAMEDLTQAYADQADLEDWYILDGCEGGDIRRCRGGDVRGGKALPVHDGGRSGSLEMCQAFYAGTANGRSGFMARGFPVARGPLSYGGSAAMPNLKKHINEESRIGERLQSFYDRYNRSRLLRFIGWDRFPQYLNLPFRQRKDGLNVFTVLFTAKVVDACGDLGIPNIPLIGGGLAAPVPTIWMANDVGPFERVTLKRPEQMPRDYHTLVAVSGLRGARFGLDYFGAPPSRGYAYAQASLVNGASVDTFSAAWRGVLMGSSELDDPGTVAREIERYAAQAFQEFSDLLEAADGQGGWERINAH